ncbi:MAG: hypothetical protein K2P70_04420 [Hyphomonadaceae bacterium]|nr:hypothetical protein [Hyphomonadaceae bacterium]
MFGKGNPPQAPGRLAERMRRAVERPSPGTALAPAQTARSARQPVFRQGTLIFAGGERFSVVIKNVSERGALIEFFVRRELPHCVVLVESTLRLKHRARVMWQRDGAAGLVFDNA